MSKLILPRRKLLKAAFGLIAAPYVAKAAFFQGAVNGPTGAAMGQQKPNGTPTYIGSSKFPGMIFYAFNTDGNGYPILLNTSSGLVVNPTAYQTPGMPCIAPTSCPNGFFDPDLALVSVGTPSGGYGTGTHWNRPASEQPGAAFIIGSANYSGAFPGNDPMALAIDMKSRLTDKSTFIQFVTFIQDADGPVFGSSVCGRWANQDSFYGINVFYIGAGTNNKISFSYINAAPPAGMNAISLESSSTHTRNDLHTAVIICENQGTSGTNTTVTLYLDGTQVAQAAGQTLVNYPNVEDQFQFGALFHSYANGHTDLPMQGYVFQSGVASGNNIASTWVSNLSSLTANPYQMLHT